MCFDKFYANGFLSEFAMSIEERKSRREWQRVIRVPKDVS